MILYHLSPIDRETHYLVSVDANCVPKFTDDKSEACTFTLHEASMVQETLCANHNTITILRYVEGSGE